MRLADGTNRYSWARHPAIHSITLRRPATPKVRQPMERASPGVDTSSNGCSFVFSRLSIQLPCRHSYPFIAIDLQVHLNASVSLPILDQTPRTRRQARAESARQNAWVGAPTRARPANYENVVHATSVRLTLRINLGLSCSAAHYISIYFRDGFTGYFFQLGNLVHTIKFWVKYTADTSPADIPHGTRMQSHTPIH